MWNKIQDIWKIGPSFPRQATYTKLSVQLDDLQVVICATAISTYTVQLEAINVVSHKVNDFQISIQTNFP